MSDGSLVELSCTGAVAHIRLACSDRRNALSWQLIEQLEAAITTAEANGCTIGVLGADGSVFSAGGDLDDQRSGRPLPVERSIASLTTTSLFMIAKVEGDVYGLGLALLGACPVVVCADHVHLVMPAAARMDVFPGGFFASLGQALPNRSLVEFGLRSTPCAAPRAAALGWITSAVPAAAVDAEVQAWIDDVSARPKARAGAQQFWRGIRG
jgi:enoyl-CoA hydratase/carnithine racemase